MDRQLLKYISTGKDIEKKGIRFYSGALKHVVDPNSKALLRFLIAEEKRHLQYFESIQKNINGKVKLPRVKKLKHPIFSRKAYAKVSGRKAYTINIFNTALEIEMMSADFYSKTAGKVKDKGLKKFLKGLAEWELGHFKLIKGHQDAIYDYLYWEVRTQGRIEA